MAGKSKKSAGADVLAKRAELEAFCKDELKMGRHFGTIHRKTCRTPDAQEWTPCASCGSKPSLYQPGAERICEFRGVLIGDPVLDREIVEVAGGTNWVAFRIPLTFRDDNTVLGYGIGAYKHADPNIMVKKAKKNALIDGTRTGFALSDLFDDADHDDPSAEQLQSSADARPAPRAPRAAAPPRSSAQPLADQPDLGATHPANVQDGPAPPAREATEASTPSPKWWEIRAEFPTARWTVCDREDKEYTIMGVIHFPADARPMSGGGARKWSPFEPNSQGKPEFKTKEPFLEYAQLNWYQLLDWAIKHRLKREHGGRDKPLQRSVPPPPRRPLRLCVQRLGAAHRGACGGDGLHGVGAGQEERWRGARVGGEGAGRAWRPPPGAAGGSTGRRAQRRSRPGLLGVA
jgi:hypothetical protein